MNIYNYKSLKKCFVCGGIEGNFDKLIKTIIDSLVNTSNYKEEVHPKEIERRERLGINPQTLEGSIKALRAYKKSREDDNDTFSNSVLIVDGSNSFGTKDLKYYYDKLKPLNDVLAENNSHLLFIRGNDDPKYFEEELLNLSNIKTIHDYSLVKLNKFNCLCIGGNVSMDRCWKKEQEKRLGKKMYWENEALTYNENELDEILNDNNVACVITVSSPSFTYPGINSVKRSPWYSKDKEILREITNERMIMDKIYNKIIERDKKPFVWVYSRYNDDNVSTVNDIVFKSMCPFQFFNFNNAAKRFFNIDFSKSLKENDFSLQSSPFSKKNDWAFQDPFEDIHIMDSVADEETPIEEGEEEEAAQHDERNRGDYWLDYEIQSLEALENATITDRNGVATIATIAEGNNAATITNVNNMALNDYYTARINDYLTTTRFI